MSSPAGQAAEALAAASALLPARVVWGSTLAYMLIGGSVSFLCMELGVALSRRWLFPAASGASADHWTVLARRRVESLAAVRAAVIMSTCIFALCASRFVGVLTGLAEFQLAGLAVVIGVGVGFLVRWRDEGRVLPHGARTLRVFVRESAATTVFLLTPLAPGLVYAFALPPRLSPWELVYVIPAMVYVIWVTFVGQPRVLALFGLAAPGSAELVALVEKCAQDAQVAMPRVWSLRLPTANAFAYVFSGQVAVTERVREVLSEQELAAVLYHELGHLNESKRTKALRALVVIPPLILLCLRPAYLLVGPLAVFLLLGMFLVPLLIVPRISRKHEEHADHAAHDHTESPAVLAYALEKLHRRNAVPPVLGKGTTHPDLYDRMLAANVQPDYERPEPPSTLPKRIALTSALLLSLAAAFGAVWLRSSLVRTERTSEAYNLHVMTWTGGDAWDLARLCFWREWAGESHEAELFFRAARAIDPGNLWHRLMYVEALLDAGRTPQARALLDESGVEASGFVGQQDPEGLESRWMEASERLTSLERESP